MLKSKTDGITIEIISPVNFMVSGYFRSGTTWLYSCMRQHPEIYVPDSIKEVHFFTTNWDKGNEWYLDLYKRSTGFKAIGEVSPGYLVSTLARDRIYLTNPKMKFIVVLRDPVERAFSAYCHRLEYGKESKNPREALTLDRGMVRDGLYFNSISSYLEKFERSQFKFLFYDDLVSKPDAFLNEAFGFLGIDPQFRPTILDKRVNQRSGPMVNNKTKHNIFKFGRSLCMRTPLTRKIYREISFRGYGRKFKNSIFPPQDAPKLPKDLARELADFFQQGVESLSTLLERDLQNQWLGKYYHDD